jgi:hypothetical protein
VKELRRGDKVCIAFPSRLIGAPTPESMVKAQRDAEADAKQWTQIFDSLGVTLLRWECNSGLNHMVVTVLFRDDSQVD